MAIAHSRESSGMVDYDAPPNSHTFGKVQHVFVLSSGLSKYSTNLTQILTKNYYKIWFKIWSKIGPQNLDISFGLNSGWKIWLKNWPKYHDLNFGSISWFWSCKEHICPLSPHLGLWRILEVPDWGLVCWSSFGYGHGSLVDPYLEFWLYILI